jgi:hypothetical protein
MESDRGTVSFLRLQVRRRGGLPSRTKRGNGGTSACSASVTLGVCLLGSALVSRAAAGQAPDRSDPNKLRPPTVAVATADEAAAATFTLFLGEVVRALEHGDTLSLKLLVPDALIPNAERAEASRLGCPSLVQAVTQLARLRSPVGQGALLVVAVSGPLVVVAPDPPSGDITLTGRTRLSLVARAPAAASWPIQIDMSHRSHARQVETVHGLLVGLCQVVPPS